MVSVDTKIPDARRQLWQQQSTQHHQTTVP